MKKSFKFLFGAILVGAVMALTSCAELTGIILQATTLANHKYNATIGTNQVEFNFKQEQQNGASYKLEVKRNGVRIDNDIIQWNIDTSATGEANLKNIFIYRYNGENNDQIGTLAPNNYAQDKLTVTGGSFYIGTFHISNGTEFNRQNN